LSLAYFIFSKKLKAPIIVELLKHKVSTHSFRLFQPQQLK